MNKLANMKAADFSSLDQELLHLNAFSDSIERISKQRENRNMTINELIHRQVLSSGKKGHS